VERARNAFLPAAEGGDGRGHAFSEAKLERASQTLIFFVFREKLRNQTENDSSPLSLTLSLSARFRELVRLQDAFFTVAASTACLSSSRILWEFEHVVVGVAGARRFKEE
jgi:hypothetical protein